MKRLETVKPITADHGFSRRDFLKAGALGLAILSGACATTDLKRSAAPYEINAIRLNDFYVPTTTIDGVEVSMLSMRHPLDEMIAKSKAMLQAAGATETRKNEKNDGAYSNVAPIKDVTFRGKIMITEEYLQKRGITEIGDEKLKAELKQKGEALAFISKDLPMGVMYYIGNDGESMGLAFPPQLDQRPDDEKHIGARLISTQNFAAMVRKNCGDYNRVMFIIDREYEFVNILAVPIDDNGTIVSKYRGGFLAYGWTCSPQDIQPGVGMPMTNGIVLVYPMFIDGKDPLNHQSKQVK